MKLAWFAGYSERPGGIAVAVLLRTSQPMGGGPHAAELAGKFFRTLGDVDYSIIKPITPEPSVPVVPPAAVQLFH